MDALTAATGGPSSSSDLIAEGEKDPVLGGSSTGAVDPTGHATDSTTGASKDSSLQGNTAVHVRSGSGYSANLGPKLNLFRDMVGVGSSKAHFSSPRSASQMLEHPNPYQPPQAVIAAFRPTGIAAPLFSGNGAPYIGNLEKNTVETFPPLPAKDGNPNPVITAPNPSAWNAILQQRHPSKCEDLKLEYIKPSIINGEMVVLCPDEEFAQNLKPWETSLVGYVMERRPYYTHFKQYLSRMWKPRGTFDVFSRENGIFIFRFGDNEDCNRILEEGPWFYDRRLMILRKWEHGTERDLKQQMHVWVKLPNLPIEWWSKDTLSRAASNLGQPLYVDRPTGRHERLSYARLCVNIGVEDDLKDEIVFTNSKGARHKQKVFYDYRPIKCTKCIVFGHAVEQCQPAKPKVQQSKFQQKPYHKTTDSYTWVQKTRKGGKDANMGGIQADQGAQSTKTDGETNGKQPGRENIEGTRKQQDGIKTSNIFEPLAQANEDKTQDTPNTTEKISEPPPPCLEDAARPSDRAVAVASIHDLKEPVAAVEANTHDIEEPVDAVETTVDTHNISNVSIASEEITDVEKVANTEKVAKSAAEAKIAATESNIPREGPTQAPEVLPKSPVILNATDESEMETDPPSGSHKVLGRLPHQNQRPNTSRSVRRNHHITQIHVFKMKILLNLAKRKEKQGAKKKRAREGPTTPPNDHNLLECARVGEGRKAYRIAGIAPG